MSDNEEVTVPSVKGDFITAREQLMIDEKKNRSSDSNKRYQSTIGTKKSLGISRKIAPPKKDDPADEIQKACGAYLQSTNSKKQEEPVDERLKGLDPKIVAMIKNEIMDHGARVEWEDIAGLEHAKNTIKEIVVWPMLRP